MPAELSIGFSVSWIARMLRTRFDTRARTLGLTRAQWSMMLSVKIQPAATQSEIAAGLEINSATAGGIIDRLETAGWIERQPDPADRRVNRLRLTQSATPVLNKLSELGELEETVMLAGLSQEEREILARLLNHIVANLTQEQSRCPTAGKDDEAAGSAVVGNT